MKIWFDIGHPAQLNFYRNAIIELSQNNIILVTIIDRGKLLKIADKEFSLMENCEIIPVGRHSGSKVSAIIDANILRLISFIGFYLKYKPQIAVGNGFLHGIIAKTFNFPSLMFGDDIERKLDVLLKTKFSTEISYLIGDSEKRTDNKIEIYNALKEWAYLSPKYFDPNKEVLSIYGLEESNYIFVREVITGTLNYHSQDKNIIATISSEFPKGIKVLLSLEDKSLLHNYPEEWLLLQEPIDDIHSLIYYSKALVSSGDSMAREAAMLGVPSIYCGIRDMKANKVMMDKGILFHVQPEKVASFIHQIFSKLSFDDNEMFRHALKEEWIDVTNLIVSKIDNQKNKIL